MNPLAFSVGGLLYSPANNATVAGHILRGDIAGLTSLCLCLEDAIKDAAHPHAEIEPSNTLEALRRSGAKLTLLFVRVKSPRRLEHVHKLPGANADAR